MIKLKLIEEFKNTGCLRFMQNKKGIKTDAHKTKAEPFLVPL
jgi:hypothetical protein